MKRVLSFLLVLTMLCSLCTAFAAEEIAVEEPAVEEAAVEVAPEEAPAEESAAEGPIETEEPALSEGPVDVEAPAEDEPEYPVTDGATYSGKFSDSQVYWSLNTATGVMSITGSGAMPDYDAFTTVDDYAAPWDNYRSYIKSVTIGSGVTNIGSAAFTLCSNLTSVSIPSTVTRIGSFAFHHCTITDVYYSGTQASWNKITIGTDNNALTNANIHYLVSGWVQDTDGSWYYYNSNNTMVKSSWINYGDAWYYLDSNGRMVAGGWYTVPGDATYCFSAGGVMLTNYWMWDGNNSYFPNGRYIYFGSDGRMVKNNWVWWGAWYYMDSDGSMVTGYYTIGGVTHSFDSSGRWLGKSAIPYSYVGSSLSSFQAVYGYPNSYSYVNSRAADSKDGTLYYSGYTVYTVRYSNGSEIIISIA